METVSPHSLWCPEKCSQQWDHQKPRWDIFTHIQPGFKRATSSFFCLFVAASLTYSPAFDPEGSAKDFKFVLMEKENSPEKKEAEKLVMNIDSGKPFISSAIADTAGKRKYQHRHCDCGWKWTRDLFLVNHLLTRLHVSSAAYSDDTLLKEKHKVSFTAAEGGAEAKCRTITEIQNCIHLMTFTHTHTKIMALYFFP